MFARYNSSIHIDGTVYNLYNSVFTDNMVDSESDACCRYCELYVGKTFHIT